ncbi:hypothetical protein [Thiohalorhabdus methylotrophus]|uniref:Uncharacterized protein n=1 Tax=Thiohalorhabdus methylotrophus TaxID=3242694 RepID=A0ABV4TT73_9GAMM
MDWMQAAGQTQDWLHTIVGPHNRAITWWQMINRAVIIFLFTVLLVRLGGKRFGRTPAPTT